MQASAYECMEAALRLLLAVLIGSVIGIERGRKGRPAGFRTHVLVCLGATITMMTNSYVVRTLGTGDPTRMAASVISGIGFLGTGTILVTGRKQIKGLTTAASLWACACVGLALGAGYYAATIMGGILIYAVNGLFQKLEGPIHYQSRIIAIYIEMQDMKVIRQLLAELREQEIKVSDIELLKQEEIDGVLIGLTANLTIGAAISRDDLQTKLLQIEGIEYLEMV